MLEILKWIIPYLGGAIFAIILLVLLREGWRSFKGGRIRGQEERCLKLIQKALQLAPEKLPAAAFELKQSFPMEVVEATLDNFSRSGIGTHEAGSKKEEAGSLKLENPASSIQPPASGFQHPASSFDLEHKRKFANLYEHLGLVEEECKKMKEAKSWPDRAASAEKLGFIGHPSAVLPLIAILRDRQEEREVKNVAMKSLGKIRDARAIPPLIEALGSPDPSTGQPLADVLVQFGAEALIPLTEVIKTSTLEPQRIWAGRILGRLDSPDGAPILIHALSDHSEKVREAAVTSLGRLKDRRGVRPLNELLLRDPSPLVRESSAEALGKIGDEKAIEFLKRGLGDMEYSARVKAMEALEAMGDKVIPIFIETLKSADIEARAQAASALERAGVVERSIEELKDQKQSKEEAGSKKEEAGSWKLEAGKSSIQPPASSLQQEKAFQLLLQIAQTGVGETIIRHLHHPDFQVRVKLCRIIRKSRHPRALDPLLDIAQNDPSFPVRICALEALVAIGDEKALPVILRSLKKEEEETRTKILDALPRLPQKQLATILPDVTPFLHDSNTGVRLGAASLIAVIQSEEAILPLLSSLKDPYEKVRAVAAEALGKTRGSWKLEAGSKKEEAGSLKLETGKSSLQPPASSFTLHKEGIVDALIEALKDSSEEVRLNAVKSLGMLKNRKAVPALVHAFEWADEASRDLIAQAIAQVPTEEIFDLIDELMGFPASTARAGIAWTLGLLPEERALKLAALFLKDKEAVVRSAAAGGVGNWFETRSKKQEAESKKEEAGSLKLEAGKSSLQPPASSPKSLSSSLQPPASDLLLPYLQDPNERVRAAVCNALAKIGDPLALEGLIELLKNEPDRFVQQRIVLAVGCLGNPKLEAESKKEEAGSWKLEAGKSSLQHPASSLKSLSSSLQPQASLINSISSWLERVDDEKSKTAGSISLVLLGDGEGFREGIDILKSPSKTKILKGLLKSLPERFGDRFLKALSFEKNLFWKEEIGESLVAAHYGNLLAISRETDERKRALAALGELETDAVLPAVETSFREDPDPAVRAQALDVLVRKLHDAPLLETILKAIQDPSEKVRGRVVPILQKISPRELKGNREKLIPLLDSQRTEIRSPVATLLARLYRDDWKTLTDAVMGTHRKSRIAGFIETLGRIADPSSIPLFSRFLESRETDIRETAIHWGQEGGLLNEGILKKLLEDPQESVRASAVRGLGRQLKPESLDFLAPRSKDPSIRVRAELAVALGRTRLAGDKRPVEILEQLTSDLNPQVRVQALVSLFKLGVSGTAKRAQSVVSDLEANEREELLSRLDREGILLELASKLANERNAGTRRESLQLLAALDPARFRKEIAESLQDPSSEVRIAAVEALGQVDDFEIQKKIELLASDPVEEVRQAVKRRKLRSIK